MVIFEGVCQCVAVRANFLGPHFSHRVLEQEKFEKLRKVCLATLLLLLLLLHLLLLLLRQQKQ